jgi:hypothetical protein
MTASSFANRFLVAAANATFICLVLNVAYFVGFFISVLMNNAHLFEIFFPRDFWLSLSLQPAVPLMRFLSPFFLCVWLLLVSIFAPSLLCQASTKFGRQEKLVGLSEVLQNARKLGLLSLLLTSAVVVVTVMLFDLVFTGWSIAYFVARILVIPLIQLLALAIVQLILQTEGEFVLPKFCSILKKDGSRSRALTCVVSFFVAISILAGTLFLMPNYYAPLFRDRTIYLVLLQLVAWLLAGVSLLRIMILENFIPVYFFCFVVSSLVLLVVFPAIVICISVH